MTTSIQGLRLTRLLQPVSPSRRRGTATVLKGRMGKAAEFPTIQSATTAATTKSSMWTRPMTSKAKLRCSTRQDRRAPTSRW